MGGWGGPPQAPPEAKARRRREFFFGFNGFNPKMEPILRAGEIRDIRGCHSRLNAHLGRLPGRPRSRGHRGQRCPRPVQALTFQLGHTCSSRASLNNNMPISMRTVTCSAVKQFCARQRFSRRCSQHRKASVHPNHCLSSSPGPASRAALSARALARLSRQ